MQLKHDERRRTMLAPLMLLAGLACAGAVFGQQSGGELEVPGALDVDFLFNYYDQDGENSPVTGGIGTEALDVVAPVLIIRWQPGDTWTLVADLGVDNITSASTDNMDLGEVEMSSASRQDARAHSRFTASRAFGENNVAFSLGFSGEYDYKSIQAGLDWSRDFRQGNTTLAAGLRHYSDTVELYGIDGVVRGEDDRTTTDLSLSLTQVLGRRTVGSIELYLSEQSGFLSTPFHEVILAPEPGAPERRVAERLPDGRSRMAVGLRLNHGFSKRFTQRVYLRYYDDDWGVTASTIELEPWFRVSERVNAWVFPILRYHSQDSSDYFGLPATFTGGEPFITADRDLSEFTSEKLGLGFRINPRAHNRGWRRWIRFVEARVSSYSRDDGLDALNVSFGIGLRIRP